jgi:hypothetical protein
VYLPVSLLPRNKPVLLIVTSPGPSAGQRNYEGRDNYLMNKWIPEIPRAEKDSPFQLTVWLTLQSMVSLFPQSVMNDFFFPKSFSILRFKFIHCKFQSIPYVIILLPKDSA